MEIHVEQRSAEWFELRQCVALTASRFGDALGLGRGKPYDFLRSLITTDNDPLDDTRFTALGVRYEPIVCEVHQLLTGQSTRQAGFWVCDDGLLQKLVGASPDAKIHDGFTDEFIGLAEYESPVYQMYSSDRIPRQYMAQIQGQMAVCGVPWCDFVAVCERTREIFLKRVHFSNSYWK